MEASEIEQLNFIRDNGKCFRTVDTERFFPDPDEGYSVAMRTCWDCPVRDECAMWAIEHGEYGVWGGLSWGQRKVYKKSLFNPKSLPINHGDGETPFNNHLKNGTIPCDECHKGWTRIYPKRKMRGKRVDGGQ